MISDLCHAAIRDISRCAADFPITYAHHDEQIRAALEALKTLEAALYASDGRYATDAAHGSFQVATSVSGGGA